MNFALSTVHVIAEPASYVDCEGDPIVVSTGALFIMLLVVVIMLVVVALVPIKLHETLSGFALAKCTAERPSSVTRISGAIEGGWYRNSARARR